MAALDVPPPTLAPGPLAALADETLVGLIAAGSDEAFAALDDRYRARLVRFARGFVPGGTADAEDAVQDAMVRAVRALRNGSRPEAVGPWLHRIARNCALDVSAARRRHPVVELADHAHPPAEDAQAAVERRLGMAGLVTDVGRLPDTQRSALVLRELEGRSYTDIADRLDVTVPAVKSLLVRARQGLKRARDDRRAVAALLPLPLLGRLAHRLGAISQPLTATATATPKVACLAVVAAGALPVAGAVEHHRAGHQPPRAAVAQLRPASARAGHVAHPAAAGRTSAAARLRVDCADGSVDGHFARHVLLRALRASSASSAGSSSGTATGEYGDGGCRDALLQATVSG